jgi:hypothetical protein
VVFKQCDLIHIVGGALDKFRIFFCNEPLANHNDF